jgi:hypothetical protein
VHVFWDMEGLHPGSQDPRLLAARITHFASGYGVVTGLYAYAVRKIWNWVPEAFLKYRGPLQDSDVRHRCSICGAMKRTAVELSAHVKAVHGDQLEQQQQQQQQQGQGQGQPAAGLQPGRGMSQLPDSASQGEVVSTRNTHSRTLGRIAEYHTSGGRVLVPPAGHQLSLKYCMTQEGWEVRP